MKNISYIIPAYNCSSTIKEALDSIFDGNYHKGDEVVVVDDASTDNTYQTLQRLQSKYTFTLAQNPNNFGGGKTRNLAVSLTHHRSIFCLDSDNILAPKSIAILRQQHTQSNLSAIAFSDLWYFKDSVDNKTHSWHFSYPQYNRDNYLTTIYVPGASGNYLYTRESWEQAGGYPEYAGALDTWGFGLRQVMTGTTISVIPDTGYYHRLSSGSYWQTSIAKISPSLQALRIILEFESELHPKSLNYVMSVDARRKWLDNLDRQPLYLRHQRPKGILQWLRS